MTVNDEGTLDVNGLAPTITDLEGWGTINGGGVLEVLSGSFGGSISQTSLKKSGTDTLYLAGDCSQSGGVTIDGGNLQFSFSSDYSSYLPPDIMINTGGALNAYGPFSDPAAWLGSGKIDTASTGTLALIVELY